MAEVKGVLVSAMTAFLVGRYGKESVEEATKALSAEDAALVRRRFLDSSLYPYATMVALRRLARVLAARGPLTGEEIGQSIADYVFKGVYKPLLTPDPVRMVEKIGWVKDFFYKDTDKVDAHMTGNSSCALVYHYEEGIRPTRATCNSLIGFWGRTLELAGARKVTATHPVCIAEGDDRCEFTFSW